MAEMNRRDALKALGLSGAAAGVGVVAGASSMNAADAQAIKRTSAFSAAGVDGFLSHFVFTIRFNKGPLRGKLISLSLPSAVQTVARSNPFIYTGDNAEKIDLAIPEGCDLVSKVALNDYLITPPAFFQKGKETVFLQILNLDAQADTRIGRIRIILGQTLKRDYPDLFEPSFGGAQSISDEGGFPARLFFSPIAVIETKYGAFKTRAKALVETNAVAFPPVGGAPTLLEPVLLDTVQSLRQSSGKVEASATIEALSHPIDSDIPGIDSSTPGDNVFLQVERAISG